MVVHGFGCRRCLRGDGPCGRVSLGEYVVVLLIDCDGVVGIVFDRDDKVAG